MHPPEPSDESRDHLDLILDRSKRVALLLHQGCIGVYILDPRAELRVERNERLFFHLARMVSRTAAGYAESLTSKLAQAGAIAGIFGIVRDSA